MSYDADPDSTRSPDPGLTRRILIVGVTSFEKVCLHPGHHAGSWI
jgi:hypothetical protein